MKISPGRSEIGACADNLGGRRVIGGFGILVLLLAALMSHNGLPAQATRPTASKISKASITATPNPVPLTEGFGKTTVTWDSGDGSWAQVYVSENDQGERLFAQGPKGSIGASWIGRASRYRFRLYRSTTHTVPLAEVVVTQSGTSAGAASAKAAAGRPSLKATPNPVAADSKDNTTLISWTTGNGSWGQLYVAVDSGAERLFVQGREGSQAATWIYAGSKYSFRLYEGTERKKLLASIVVVRAKAGQPPVTGR